MLAATVGDNASLEQMKCNDRVTSFVKCDGKPFNKGYSSECAAEAGREPKRHAQSVWRRADRRVRSSSSRAPLKYRK